MEGSDSEEDIMSLRKSYMRLRNHPHYLESLDWLEQLDRELY